MSSLSIAVFKKASLILILFDLYFSFAAKAQQTQNSIEINIQKSLSIFSDHNHALQGNAYGGEITYHFNATNSQKAWAKDLKVKSIDLIFNYKNMRNVTRIAEPIKGEHGDSYTVLTGLTLPVLNIKKVSLDFAPAFGLLYTGQSWFTNQNPLVASKLNFFVKGALKLNAALNPKTDLVANIDISHYSNSASRVPNNGINMTNVGIGLKRYLSDNRQTEEKKDVSADTYTKHTFDLGVGIGRRGVFQSKDYLYKTGLYFGYNYRLASYLALSTGLDAVYYHTIFDPDRHTETYQSNATSFKRWRVGAAIGPDLWMGKLAIMLKYGYYIYYDSLRPINTYCTFGGKYKLNNWLALQSKIYIHQTEADYVGFGLMITK